MRHADMLVRRAFFATVIGLVLAVAAVLRVVVGDATEGTLLLFASAVVLSLYSRNARRRAERIYARAYDPRGRF